MRYPAELLDRDRQPRPMSKRIPSPYSGPPVVPRPKEPTPWLGVVAVIIIAACSTATFAVGALTILDWLRGAL